MNHFSCDDIITAEYDPERQASVLRRHTSDELKEWLNDYSLGELWRKMCSEGCRYDTDQCDNRGTE